MKKFCLRVLEKIWSIIISLRLAVLVIAGLAITLAIATTIESKFDSKTAQYYVYRASWFYGVLLLLGLNILAVALSRLPWKKRHTPFLMAHAGILMILVGSWLTYSIGLDGSVRISEGEMSSSVELDQHVLLYKKGEAVMSEPFPWMPAAAAVGFKGLVLAKYGIKVEKYIADSEMKLNFIPTEDPKQAAGPALQIKILGSPMGGAPEVWLWAGDPAWATQKMGLARFLIRDESRKDIALPEGEHANGEARVDFIVTKKGELRFETMSIRGEKKVGKIDLALLDHQEEPVIINPEWRMPIQIQVKKFVPHGMNVTSYVPAGIKPMGMGTAIPQPAIQVSLLSNPDSKLWLGLGDRADFNDRDGVSVSLGYFPKQVMLPYGIRLKEFQLKHNPGTMDPSAYSSFVQVVDQFQKSEKDMEALPIYHITMNEPMPVKGYTFYQASYIPEFPRPTTTILSVNYDPGRGLKYWGSILLVLGAISLYLVKVVEKKTKKEKNT